MMSRGSGPTHGAGESDLSPAEHSVLTLTSLQWKCEFGVTWFGGSNLSLSSDGIAVYTRPPEAHGRDTLPQPPSRLPPLRGNFERLGWIFGDCFDDGVW